MPVLRHVLSAVFVSATLPLISTGTAQASEICTVKTARQSVSSDTFCACNVVSSSMLRYLQRRADFEQILERTLIDCPAFALLLTDLPTASTSLNDQRSGDGPSDETQGGIDLSDGEDNDDGDKNPGGKDPSGGGTDDNPKGGGGPGSETPKGGGGPGSETTGDTGDNGSST